MSKLGPISHFLSPVSCDSLLLQGLRCEWGAGVLNLVLSVSLSHTGQWKLQAVIQAVHSLIYIVAKCHFFCVAT